MIFLESVLIPTAKAIKATDAINKPPVLAPILLITLVAITNIAKAPPIAVNDFFISSHDRDASFFKATP